MKVLLAAIVLAAAPVSLRAQDLGIEIGSTAPSAKVHTLDGKEADLAQYVGKTAVVMEFWATWCPNCKELEPAWLEASKKYGKQVKFVSVAGEVRAPRLKRGYLSQRVILLDEIQQVGQTEERFVPIRAGGPDPYQRSRIAKRQRT
jgi:thiol-disulfide isomerase/thioredoxin